MARKQKTFNFKDIINSIIEEINVSKIKSNSIHNSGNIKSSGDEVEKLIRDKISLFLPERYMVKQGHLINSLGLVSKQFDIIIFDRLNTPKFFEAGNDTVYYPIESVLAIGEIKKTLRSKDITEFRKKIKHLKVDMNRVLDENTIFGGNILRNTTFTDLANMSPERKYKNPLFSFIFAIDVENIEQLYFDDEYNYIPNDICILNHGSIIYGEIVDKKFNFKIEDENPPMDTWVEIKRPVLICLSTLLYRLTDHLNQCHVDPYSIASYISNPNNFGIKGSEIKVIKFN